MYFEPDALPFSYSRRCADVIHTEASISGNDRTCVWHVSEVYGTIAPKSLWSFTVQRDGTANKAVLNLHGTHSDLDAIASRNGLITLKVRFNLMRSEYLNVQLGT